MVSQMQAHLNLVLVFPVPLAIYLVLRLLDGTVSTRRFVLSMGGLLAFEFGTSTEVFATATMFGGVALAGCWLFLRERRRETERLAGLICVAYLIAAALVSPMLLYLWDEPLRTLPDIPKLSSDLMGWIVPRNWALVGGQAFVAVSSRFTSTTAEDGTYLGVPLISMLALFAITRRRERSTWLLLGIATVAAVFSMGPVLHVDGRILPLRLPWYFFQELPLVGFAIPSRFTMYVALVAAVMVSIILSKSSGKWQARAAWALTLAAIASLIPDVGSTLPKVPRLGENPPAFIAQDTYERMLTRGQTVVIIPHKQGDQLAWQAETGMYFRLAVGPTQAVPPGAMNPVSAALLWNDPALMGGSPGAGQQLSEWLRDTATVAIILEAQDYPKWSPWLGGAGLSCRVVGGVELCRTA